MKLANLRQSAKSRRGTIALVMMIALVGLAGLSLALLSTALSGGRSQRNDRERSDAHYVCQAGLSNAVFNLQRGVSGALGAADAPVQWGSSRYWVEETNLTAELVQLRASGLDDRTGLSMELVLRRVPDTIWRYAAFGDEFLHMDSNARVDSYNSVLGTYAAQAINGSGSNQHGLTNGDVGSNGDVTMDQNSKVWGDATAGPEHTSTVLGNAVVTGSLAPASQPLELPAINVPSYASLGALTVSGATTIPSGNRAYTNLTVNNNKTLTINGPARIVVTNLRVKSGGRININATGGPVEIWVIDDFILDSNAVMAPTNFKPENLKLNLLSDNVINPEVAIEIDTLSFNSNTQLYGTLYAPNARIEINSNFQLFGAIIARSIDLDSNCRVHFDEALLAATAAGDPTYETVYWREIPFVEPAGAP